MVHAIDFQIISKNNTLRHDLSMMLPDDRDGRVLNKEYRLNVSFCLPEGGASLIPTLSGSIKCHSKDDVVIVLNNLITLLDANTLKVEKGSELSIHYCRQVEDGVPVASCTREIVWSN